MNTVFAYDTETEKTRAGLKAPPMACLTFQRAAFASPNTKVLQPVGQPEILHGRDPLARDTFEAALVDPETLIVGHFVAYDMGVCAAKWPDLIPGIFAAYEADRVTDTMLREKLFDIATGKYRGFPDEKGVWRKHDYNLDAVARRRCGYALKKDGWRKRYGEVIDLPLADWPRYAAEQKKIAIEMLEAGIKDKDIEAVANGDPNEIRTYPLGDAGATLGSFLNQESILERCDADPYADQFRQARASWWLTLMTPWGVRTRAEGARELRLQTEQEIAKLTDSLVAAGLVRTDGTRDTKKAAARMLEVCGWSQEITAEGRSKKYKYTKLRDDARPLRKTDTDNVSLDRDACEGSLDELLEDYGERAQLQAVLDKDVPMIEAGTYMPIHPRVDLAESGRTTMGGPNLQNVRKLPGIRESFIPRDGSTFAQADFPGLELHTLGQVCLDLFGASELARMLNAGIDPHLAFAAKLLGIEYDEAKRARKDSSHPLHAKVKKARDLGKVFNFGSPGGLGKDSLVTYARKNFGVTITPDEAVNYKQDWLHMLPEMREFFAYNGRLTKDTGEGTILQLRSKRIRGGAMFCALCNTWFQGLGADAAKHAGFLISKACYVDRTSPLFGSRIVNFVHDEFITETPDNDNAHDAAHEQARLMMVGANEFVPDVPFRAGEIEPQLMRIWSKDAEPVHGVNGRLVSWEPALAGLLGMGRAIASRTTLPVAA